MLECQELSKKNFSGSLLLKNNYDKHWKIYFRLGRLIWFTAPDLYFQEQWKRHIQLFFSHISNEERVILLKEKSDKYYLRLANLYYKTPPSNQQNIINLIISIFGDFFFDLIQYQTVNKEKFASEVIPHDKPEALITLIKLELVEQQAMRDWTKWKIAGLSDYSPNLFPTIENFNLVQKQLNPELISLIDGTQSLRSLAAKSNLNLVDLTTSLLELLQVKAISLTEAPRRKNPAILDIPSHTSINSSISANLIHTSINKEGHSPLVICVDDSPLVCRDMKEIISKTPYRFLSIQDSLKAISLIVKNSPDLIFLDLMMPVVNGYELCSQLRKIPNFQNTPIIILTGKDGLVDRVRAKVVGATDFISKPLNSQAILALIYEKLFTSYLNRSSANS